MSDSNRDGTASSRAGGESAVNADDPLEALEAQLQEAAAAFAGGEDDLDDLLAAMADDVERASTERLEVLPVSHHSPASAVQTARRLYERQPDVVYLEMCEDLDAVLDELAECTTPVALQAFADESEAFPAEWTPLTVVAPLTEFSAEAQVIGYAMATDAEVVFVDRSVDHVFQQASDDEYIEDQLPSQDPDVDDDGSHSSALGLQIGDTEPTFEAFRRFLLRNARVRHWMEWWNQYVEQPVTTADYETYRHALFLVGTLLRRIGREDDDRAEDRFRERYMWTRIREHMAAEGVDPDDALYVCGAIHAVSDVEAFGVESDHTADIAERTDTDWQYGIVPSSYREIDRQYGHPPGTIKRNEHSWETTRRAADVPSYDLAGEDPPSSGDTEGATDPEERLAEIADQTAGFLDRPPELADEDDEQLLNWCIDIVDAAQDEGYAASTADAIAVFEHATLLAKMRNRPHPTPYDFREAAITCIQKTETAGRTGVGTLCDRILGGDREGAVGYASLPPLAQDVYDRLEDLPIDPHSRTIERALLDFQEDPEYREAADLLWRLDYLLDDADVVRPIMGTRELGHEPVQESWDLLTGKNQRPLIELGYQGVTVEQVLAMELKEEAYGASADAVSALEATRDSIVYLDSERLTGELGQRAVELLSEETGADNAGPIFDQARELVHHFRSEPGGIPTWLEEFVAEGYSQYARLLPKAFEDEDTAPDDIADMLAFIFTLESLALSIGRDRTELEIAVDQAGTVDTTPDKVGLLWAAELLLEERTEADVRTFFDRALDNSMLVPKIPEYLRGFVLSMRFAKQMGPLVVELVSEAFARLPDDVLLPWLPDLLLMLEPMEDDLVPELVREAGRTFPGTLPALDEWVPDWEAEDGPPEAAGQDQPPAVTLSDRERAVHDLLDGHRAAADATATYLDVDGEWTALPAGGPARVVDDERARGARSLLFDHRESATAVTAHLDLQGDWTNVPTAAAMGGQKLGDRERSVRALLGAHRATTDGVAELVGADAEWADPTAPAGSRTGGASGDPVSRLLAEHADTLEALLD